MFEMQAINAMTSDKEVCERVVETKLHSDMLADLKKLPADSLKEAQSDVKKEFVQRQVSTLHNVVRKAETARTAFRECNAVTVMQKFVDLKVIIFTHFNINNVVNFMRSFNMFMHNVNKTKIIGRCN